MTRILLLLQLMIVLLGCSRGANDLPDIQVQLQVTPDPPRTGPATISVALSDASGQPIQGATVELEGNMSHAGMVPVSARASEVAPGRYQADLEFTMVGDWLIIVRADLPDGRSMERVVDLPGVDQICGETPEPAATP